MTIGILSEKCNLPKTEFLTAVRLILDFTYFVFDNIIYKQNFDMLMNSPLLPIIADLVMQRLGRTTLSLFNDQGFFFISDMSMIYVLQFHHLRFALIGMFLICFTHISNSP